MLNKLKIQPFGMATPKKESAPIKKDVLTHNPSPCWMAFAGTSSPSDPKPFVCSVLIRPNGAREIERALSWREKGKTKKYSQRPKSDLFQILDVQLMSQFQTMSEIQTFC